MRYPESEAVGVVADGVVGPPRLRLSPDVRPLVGSPRGVVLRLGGSDWVGVLAASPPAGVRLLLLLPPGGRPSLSAGLEDLGVACVDLILLAGKV